MGPCYNYNTMITQISPQKLLSSLHTYPIIDVRAPKEFTQGHIPGALNVPLFSDTQRALVGTTYKQQGKEDALRVGIEIVGPHINNYIDTLQSLTHEKTVVVYCWRGGMRSKSICMLLNFFGYTTYQITGGYKAFRQYLYAQAERPYSIVLLGGTTGCGKTHLLTALADQGEQIIDLEKIAHHKGSAFGELGEQPQPTQEQFITNCLLELAQKDPNTTVWIEKESSRIGNISLPQQLWHQMEQAPVIYINVPEEQRIKNLLHDYGTFSKEQLKACVLKLTKQLGNERTRQLMDLLDQGDYKTGLKHLLAYYDKLYAYGLTKQSNHTFYHLDLPAAPFDEQATIIKNYYQTQVNHVRQRPTSQRLPADLNV